MTTKIYDEYEKEALAKAKVQAQDYAKARRAQAKTAAAKAADTYTAAMEEAERQYTASAKETEDSYRSWYDANAVNELIGRRHAEEAIANAGLQNSGLNATHHTALSLQRGHADYTATAQKQKAVDSIMRELDAVRADYRMKAATEQNRLLADAETDILSYGNSLQKAAGQNAMSLYNLQMQREQAQLDREHALTMKGLSEIQKQQEDYIAKGTANAVKSLWSPNAVQLNAKIINHRKGFAAADDFLRQAVNNRYIDEKQSWAIKQNIGIADLDRPNSVQIAQTAAGLLKDKGADAAKEYLDSLYTSGMATYSDVEAMRIAMGFST